jgi:hypothetical protein
MVQRLIVFLLSLFNVNKGVIISIGLKFCLKYLKKAFNRTVSEDTNSTLNYYGNKVFPRLFKLIDSNYDDDGMFEILSKINKEGGELSNIGAEAIMESGNISKLILSTNVGGKDIKSTYDIATKLISVNSDNK